MAQSAQHRAAQRRIAREIREGTYRPTGVGKQAREVASNQPIIREIQEYKNRIYGHQPKFNQRRSDLSAASNPKTGKPWSREQLEKILAVVEASQADYDRDAAFFRWDDLFDDDDGDLGNAFYYH
jgi:hypothetical protein